MNRVNVMKTALMIAASGAVAGSADVELGPHPTERDRPETHPRRLRRERTHPADLVKLARKNARRRRR